MRIVVDAMGGDHAPHEVINGALDAALLYDADIILVGDQRLIEQELPKDYKRQYENIFIVHADETISMEDTPAVAVRKKKNSSIHVGLKMVKSGEASAFFSAGNTGAIMGVSKLILRTLDGVDRPAIGAVLPAKANPTLLLDVGANVDCKPLHYLQFAIMGSAYAKIAMGVENPRVGLLSIGEEEMKGTELTKSAYHLLNNIKVINFTGNVEGKELFKGVADVVVCDGFAGNIALKVSESTAWYISMLLKEELTRTLLSKIGALLAKKAFDRIKKRADYTEYGGAPLLGVNGVVIIGHGSSNANAIKNGIKTAYELSSKNLNKDIQKKITEAYNLLKVDRTDSFWNNIKEKIRKINQKPNISQ